MTRSLAPAAFAALLSGAAAAEPHLVSLTVDNDFFVGLDQHYTSGIQAAFLADIAPACCLPPLRWSVDEQALLAVGQRIYTPANTDRDVPDPRDRPYAGWTYLMADVRTRADTVTDHVSVTLGLVGPGSGGRRLQDWFHRSTSEPLSRGWDAQLRNEPTLMVGYERAWPAVAQLALGGGRADLAVRAGAVAGTPFTYAATGAVLRFGPNLPSDLPANPVSLAPSVEGFRGAARFGWYAWVGTEGRVVARNLFVQGNTFRASPGVGLRRFGLDGAAGVVAAWPAVRVGFTLVRRSLEFEGQGGADKYGQLTVSYMY